MRSGNLLPFLLPAAALCGLAIPGIEAAGKTGHDLYWGTLELFCGAAAGWGLAALWLEKKNSRFHKILCGILLLCAILHCWLWVPFAIAYFCRNAASPEPDRAWACRVLFAMVTIFCSIGGFGFFYWGWSDPVPDIPVSRTLAGLGIALLVPVIAGYFLLKLPPKTLLVWFWRYLALFAGWVLVSSLLKLHFRPPEPWFVYTGLSLLFAAASVAGWRHRSPPNLAKVLRGTWGVVLLVAGMQILLDCWLDRRYFGTPASQQLKIDAFAAESGPLLDACRKYRAHHQAWPEDEEELKPFTETDPGTPPTLLRCIGCYTDEKGDFRIFFKRGYNILIMAYCFGADGREKWEIIARDHPMMQPGDRRWKHGFPYTD